MTYDVNDQAEKSLLESKYRRSQELRASFDYETFADAAEDARNADAEERRFPKGGRESHRPKDRPSALTGPECPCPESPVAHCRLFSAAADSARPGGNWR